MTLGHDGHLSDEQKAGNRYAAAQPLEPGRSQQKTKHTAILERMQRDRPIAGAATGWSSDLLPGRQEVALRPHVTLIRSCAGTEAATRGSSCGVH
jgi:hypothetical protein